MQCWWWETSGCECNSTLQELNVEVRGIRHLSVHNLKKKRETNRMKWVRVSLSLCYFSLAFDRLVRDDGTKNRHYPGLPYRGFGD